MIYADRGYCVARGKREGAAGRASAREDRDDRAQEGTGGSARVDYADVGVGGPTLRLWRLGRPARRRAKGGT